jgi:hypothetical protein
MRSVAAARALSLLLVANGCAGEVDPDGCSPLYQSNTYSRCAGATPLVTLPQELIEAITLEGDAVFISSTSFVGTVAEGRLWRVSTAGGAPQLLHRFPGWSGPALAARPDAVFMPGNAGAGVPSGLWEIPTNGAGGRQIVTGVVLAVAADDRIVVWAETDQTDHARVLRSLPRDAAPGAPPALLAHFDADVQGLALDANFVYLTIGNGRLAPAPPSTFQVVAVPRDGGPVVTLVDGLAWAGALVLDGSELFVADSEGIERISVRDGSRSTKVRASATGFSVQGDGVYWASAHFPAGPAQIRGARGASALGFSAPTWGTPVVVTDRAAVYWPDATAMGSGLVMKRPLLTTP